MFRFLLIIFLLGCNTAPEIKTLNPTPEFEMSIDERIETLNSEAESLVFRNKFKEAKTKLEEAIFVKENSQSYYLLGNINFKELHFLDAKENFEKALAIDSQSEIILLNYAILLNAMGDNKNAYLTYEKLYQNFPEEEYIFKMAILAKSNKEYNLSYEIFKKIRVELLKQKSEFYLHFADAAFQLKKYEEAKLYFNQSKYKDIDFEKKISLAEKLEMGNYLLKNKKYSEAALEYKSGILISPKDSILYYFLGTAYKLQGENKKAEAEFLKAIDLDANIKNVYVDLANSYLDSGKNSEAKKILIRGVERIPDDFEIHNLLGIVYQKLGSSKNSILEFMKARELKPDFFEASLNIAESYSQENRFFEAKLELDFALKKNPDNIKIKEAILNTKISEYIEKSNSHLQSFDFVSSLTQLNLAKLLDPNSFELQIGFGKYYLKQNDLKSSEDFFLKALKIREDSEVAIFYLSKLYRDTGEIEKLNRLENQTITKNKKWQKGIFYEASNDFEKAEKIYVSEYKLNPNDENVLNRLSILYYKKSLSENKNQNYEKALQYIGKAKFYNPNLYEVILAEKIIQDNLDYASMASSLRIANQFLEKKDFKNALQEYEKLTLSKKKSSLLIRISECNLSLGKFEKSLSILQDAILEDPQNEIEYREAMGSLYLKTDQTKKATEIFNFILKRNPESFYSHYQLGIINLHLDKMKSKNHLDKAILLNPEFYPSYIARGIVLYKLGFREEAKRNFEFSISKNSLTELSNYNLGVLLLNDNLHEDAESLFKKLIDTNPSFSEGFYNLSFIEFQKGNLENAEKYIVSALNLKRTPESISAYIKILETRNEENPSDSVYKKIGNLKKEIVEGYSTSKLAYKYSNQLKKQSSSYLKNFPLKDILVGDPILLSESLILNYGSAIYSLDKETTELKWRLDSKFKYSRLVAGNRIYALNEKFLEQIHIDTGKILWRIMNLNFNEIHTYANGFYAVSNSLGQRKISSYSLRGEIISELNISFLQNPISFFDGNLLVYEKQKDGIEFKIYDSKLKILHSSSLYGNDLQDLLYRFSDSSSCFFQSKYAVYKITSFADISKSKDFSNPINSVYYDSENIIVKTDINDFTMNKELKQIKKISGKGNDLYLQKYFYRLQSDSKLEIYNSNEKKIWEGSIPEISIFSLQN
jgi:tetratricopeptide (TPR) repeat protein